MPPPVFFSFRIAFAVVGLLWFHINLRIICSSSVENVLDSLIGITSKSVDCFGYYGFFFSPFMPHPGHMEVPRPGIDSNPQLRSTLQQ